VFPDILQAEEQRIEKLQTSCLNKTMGKYFTWTYLIVMRSPNKYDWAFARNMISTARSYFSKRKFGLLSSRKAWQHHRWKIVWAHFLDATWSKRNARSTNHQYQARAEQWGYWSRYSSKLYNHGLMKAREKFSTTKSQVFKCCTR